MLYLQSLILLITELKNNYIKMILVRNKEKKTFSSICMKIKPRKQQFGDDESKHIEFGHSFRFLRGPVSLLKSKAQLYCSAVIALRALIFPLASMSCCSRRVVVEKQRPNKTIFHNLFCAFFFPSSFSAWRTAHNGSCEWGYWNWAAAYTKVAGSLLLFHSVPI